MSKIREIQFVLERLLNQSQQDKLLYLNTADRQDLPLFKRFFNQEALIRNSLFHAISTILTTHDIAIEDVLLKRPNMAQFMRSDTTREKKNSFIKCLEQDYLLLESLEKLSRFNLDEKSRQICDKYLSKIRHSIQENELYCIEISAEEHSSHELI